jgi:hypothetical protein
MCTRCAALLLLLHTIDPSPGPYPTPAVSSVLLKAAPCACFSNMLWRPVPGQPCPSSVFCAQLHLTQCVIASAKRLTCWQLKCTRCRAVHLLLCITISPSSRNAESSVLCLLLWIYRAVTAGAKATMTAPPPSGMPQTHPHLNRVLTRQQSFSPAGSSYAPGAGPSYCSLGPSAHRPAMLKAAPCACFTGSIGLQQPGPRQQ